MHQRLHQRKPLTRITLNNNINIPHSKSNTHNFISHIDEYLHLFLPKKRPKTYNLRSTSTNNNTHRNPQYVNEYIKDISAHLIAIDQALPLTYGYMSKQPEINLKMRAILVDWLVDVHLKFKLTKETLYITVNIIDKYLSKVQIQRNKLQLVGITAMFIACKYEEIYPPELKDHVYITDQTYSKEDIINMELNILATLNFDITFPTALRCLEVVINNDNEEDECLWLFAQYLMELCLVEYNMLKYTNGEIAIGCFCIACKVRNGQKEGKGEKGVGMEGIARSFGYSLYRMKDCLKDVGTILENADSYWLQAVKKKFSLEQYKNIANWKKGGSSSSSSSGSSSGCGQKKGNK